MFTVTLFIYACLSDGRTCKQHSEQFLIDYHISEAQCMSQSIVLIPKWVSEHPDWKPEKWSCQVEQADDSGEKVQRQDL